MGKLKGLKMQVELIYKNGERYIIQAASREQIEWVTARAALGLPVWLYKDTCGNELSLVSQMKIQNVKGEV